MRRKLPEAAVALCRCNNCHQLFGIRFEKISGEWKCNWAFPLQEKAAKHEGYGKTTIKGDFNSTDEYPGCPHCGEKGFLICQCGKLTAIESPFKPNKVYRCEWCGYESTLVAYDGSGFESGSDR